jgi:hypothetical protein
MSGFTGDWILQMVAARYFQALAGEPFGVRAAEERNDAADIVWSADATQGGLGLDMLLPSGL